MWPFSKQAPQSEHRDYVDLSGFTNFTDVGRGNTKAGVSITQATALTLPVVYSCINLNSQVIASLPVGAFKKSGDERIPANSPSWLERPNDEQDWGEFIAQVLVSRYLDGNAFIIKAQAAGRVTALYVMNPTSVKVDRLPVNGKLQLVYDVQTGDGRLALYPNEVIHIKGMTPPGQLRGLSPIACAAETLGLAKAAEILSAEFFGNSAILSGVIETPGAMTQEQAERLKEAFTKKHGGLDKAFALGILSGGATFKPLTVSPKDALAIDAMKLTGIQIAHIFGCPPYMVTDAPAGAGYVTSLLASRMDWYTVGLQPEIVRLERALSALLPRKSFIRFNMRGFLRGDAAETAAMMTAEVQNGVTSPERWRAILDYEPSGMPEVFFMQGGTFALGEDGLPIKPEPPVPPPAEPAPDDTVDEPAESGLFDDQTQEEGQ